MDEVYVVWPFSRGEWEMIEEKFESSPTIRKRFCIAFNDQRKDKGFIAMMQFTDKN